MVVGFVVVVDGVVVVVRWYNMLSDHIVVVPVSCNSLPGCRHSIPTYPTHRTDPVVGSDTNVESNGDDDCHILIQPSECK